MKKKLLIIVLTIMISGCTHSLNIINEQNFKPSHNTPSEFIKIGFLPTEDKLLNSVIDDMRFNSSVKDVKKNYQIGSKTEVDYIIELSKNIKYRAAGQNFFITFPGFIIFAHASIGYKYFIDIETQVDISDPTGKNLNKGTVLTPYEIRYTSFARGAAASLLGWLTPGFGLLNIIPGGIFANTYDERATPEFIENVKPSYKAFVSSKILELITKNGKGTASSTLHSRFQMEPLIINENVTEDIVDNTEENKFTIYVMKIDGDRLIQHFETSVELSKNTWKMLDKIAKNEIIPGKDNIKQILLSLGISGLPFPMDMNTVNVSTIQEDKEII